MQITPKPSSFAKEKRTITQASLTKGQKYVESVTEDSFQVQ